MVYSLWFIVGGISKTLMNGSGWLLRETQDDKPETLIIFAAL